MNILAVLPAGRFVGLLGVGLVFAIAYAVSKHKKSIALDVVLKGFGLQVALAYFILCTS
jgi:nucleoside permease NupC